MVAPTCSHWGAYPCPWCKEEIRRWEEFLGAAEHGDKDLGMADPMAGSVGTNRGKNYRLCTDGVGVWSEPRQLPMPGDGKTRGGEITHPKNLGKKLSLIPTGFVLFFDVFLKTNWGSLTSIICTLFTAAFILLLHWYVLYPFLWWAGNYFPTTKRLLSENKHLREQNQKLLQRVSKESEYR